MALSRESSPLTHHGVSQGAQEPGEFVGLADGQRVIGGGGQLVGSFLDPGLEPVSTPGQLVVLDEPFLLEAVASRCPLRFVEVACRRVDIAWDPARGRMEDV